MMITKTTSVLYIHTDATLSLQTTVASYQYYLKVTASGGAEYWAAVSPDTKTQFTFSVVCVPTSTDITSSITTFEYEYLKDNANKTFEFEAFTCTNPSCCLPALNYKVLASKTDLSKVHSELPTPVLDTATSKVFMTLPNTAVTTFEFWILAENQYTTQIITPNITINLVFDCSLDITTPKADSSTVSKYPSAFSSQR